MLGSSVISPDVSVASISARSAWRFAACGGQGQGKGGGGGGESMPGSGSCSSRVGEAARQCDRLSKHPHITPEVAPVFTPSKH